MPIDPASAPDAATTPVGPADQPQTTQVEHIDLVSTNLAGADYDPKTGRLLVTFSRGDRRLYEGVPAYKVQALKDAPSAGRYFRDEIGGGQYPMTAV